MIKIEKSNSGTKKYDLEERTFKFALKVKNFVKNTPKIASNFEYTKQLIRSSGSVAANYIEANESISKKDCLLRIKICRKEARESRLWVRLFECGGSQKLNKESQEISQECLELTKIFTTIVIRLSAKLQVSSSK